MTVHFAQQRIDSDLLTEWQSMRDVSMRSITGQSMRDVSMRSLTGQSVQDVSMRSLTGQSVQDMSICSLVGRSIRDVSMHDVLRRTLSDVLMTDVVSITADLERTAEMPISVIGGFEAPRSGLKRSNPDPVTPPRKQRKRLKEEDHTPKTERQYQQFKKATGLVSPYSREGFGPMKRERDFVVGSRDPNLVSYLSPERMRPGAAVNKEGVHVFTRVAGKGAESKVVFASLLNQQATPEKRVVKISEMGFSPQKETVDSLPRIDQLDPIYSTGRTGGLKPKSLMFGKAADGDITKMNYMVQIDPVNYLLEQLKNCAIGIQAMHSGGVIHRDIKGENILYKEGEVARITDYGFSKRLGIEEERHKVAGSLLFYAPFIWENILEQRYVAGEDRKLNSYGHQSKASDIFAFGMTLQLDFLEKIIAQLAEKHGLGSVSSPLKEEWIEGPFTDAEILEIDRRHPGRVLIVPPSISAGRYERLVKFPTREVVYERTAEAIDNLSNVLKPNEVFVLKELAMLAHDMQSPHKEKIPEAGFVVELTEGYQRRLSQ